MSRRRSLGARCRPPRRRGKSSRLARLTRVAAKRTKRGIIPRPTEINSSLPTQPGKVPENLAPPHATVWCASNSHFGGERDFEGECDLLNRGAFRQCAGRGESDSSSVWERSRTLYR